MESENNADEKFADKEISFAMQASKDADLEEPILGLGPSKGPIYVQVRPRGGIPPQYIYCLKENEETPIFTYFAIKGLGEVQRMMFAEANVPYDHIICVGGEDQSMVAEWRTRSPNGLLPTLSGMGIPRSSPISQSGAIIRFLARRLGMNGFDERGSVDADWLYETAKDMGSHARLVASTKEGDEKDMAAKKPFSTADRVAKLLATMPDPKKDDTAMNYGQIQLFKFLQGCEGRRQGCVKENLGEDLDNFRIAMESRPRLKAYIASPLCMPFTLNEISEEAEGGYSYADGVTVSRRLLQEFSG